MKKVLHFGMKSKKVDLPPEVISSFNSALSKLTGYERRQFAAELCEKFFDSSARKMERYLKAGREMIELGLHERRTGIPYSDAFSKRGAKKKK